MSFKMKYPTNLCERFDAFLIILAVVLHCASRTSADAGLIESKTLEDMYSNGWVGIENSVSYSRPSDFLARLDNLDRDSDGIWIQNNVGIFEHKFDCLTVDNGIGTAKVEVKFYSENVAMFFYPCDTAIDNSPYCYFQPSYSWATTYFPVNITKINEIQIVGLILPEGFAVFETVTISHDGDADAGCFTSSKTTTMSTAESAETEATDGPTWYPTTGSKLPTTGTITHTTSTEMSTN